MTYYDRPMVNEDTDYVADRAKYHFATATEVLAGAQYRLAELADAGEMDPEESQSLQRMIIRAAEQLYCGTISAVRHPDHNEDDTQDWADNHYSDGREVWVKVRVEPWEIAACVQPGQTTYLLGDGAINDCPRGVVSVINHWNPDHKPPEPLTRRLEDDEGDQEPT